MKSKSVNKPRFTIGLLINQLDGLYQAPLWRGVVRVAEEKNVNLVIFSGKCLNSPVVGETVQNIVYDAASPERLDGLIVASGAIASFVTEEGFAAFLSKYSSIPIVSVSMPVDGLPSILVDGKIGMQRMVDHLIEAHGYRNIAFIRGPKSHGEANDRYNGYLESLKAHGISLGENYIYFGNFLTSDGEAAAVEFVRKRQLKLDAIVAANDEMAMGAHQAIKKMGLRIPKDIALAGFDDIKHTQVLSPTLTTVKNPIYEMGKKAAETLLEILQGQKVPMQFELPTELVFRQSCGCNQPSLAKFKEEKVAVHRSHKHLDENQIIQLLQLPDKNRNYYETLFHNLLEALFTDLESRGGSDNFLNLFDIVANQIDFEDENLRLWAANLSIIRDSVAQDLDDPFLALLVEAKLEKARNVLNEAINSRETQNSIENEMALWGLRDILRDISSAVSVDSLMKVIEDSFPPFGIKSCYITQLQPDGEQGKTGNHVLPKFSLLLTGFTEYRSFTRNNQNYVFPTREIIPDEIVPSHRRYTLIVMPLVRHSEVFGLFMTELGPKVDMVYGILREQIGNAFVGCELIQNIELSDAKLKNTLTELQKSEERFREMAMFLPTIIIETDLNLDLTFLNKAGFELFGLDSQKPLKSTNLSELVCSDDRVRLKQNCSRIIYGELPNLGDIRLVNREGHEINLISKASLIQRDNRIEGIRWSAIDIKPLVTSVFTPDQNFFDHFRLSKREVEIVNLILQGYRNKEIADKLFISETTVKYHIYHIYTKMNVKSKSEFFEALKSYQVGRFGQSSFMYSILTRMIKE